MSELFNDDKHIVNVLHAIACTMYDDMGVALENITGVAGAGARISNGLRIGVDRIIIQPGGGFPLHTHEGAHLLYVLCGTSGLNIDGQDYTLEKGDSIYVPAEYPHGITGPLDDDPVQFLAFGVPHHPIDSQTRMTLVREPVVRRG